MKSIKSKKVSVLHYSIDIDVKICVVLLEIYFRVVCFCLKFNIDVNWKSI
jgi:hypothetical protein